MIDDDKCPAKWASSSDGFQATGHLYRCALPSGHEGDHTNDPALDDGQQVSWGDELQEFFAGTP